MKYFNFLNNFFFIFNDPKSKKYISIIKKILFYSLVFYILYFTHNNHKEITNSFKNIGIKSTLISIILTFLIIHLRAAIILLLLRILNIKIKFKHTLKLVSFNTVLNLMPIPAGLLHNSLYLKEKFNLDYHKSIYLVLKENIIFFFTVVFFFLILNQNIFLFLSYLVFLLSILFLIKNFIYIKIFFLSLIQNLMIFLLYLNIFSSLSFEINLIDISIIMLIRILNFLKIGLFGISIPDILTYEFLFNNNILLISYLLFSIFNFLICFSVISFFRFRKK
jgi:hypothetical protein